MEQEHWQLIGFVLAGKYRLSILKFLSKRKGSPKTIAKFLTLSSSTVSNTIRDLLKKNLIVCLNPDAKKGRLFQLTTLGDEINIEIVKIMAKE